MCCEFPELTTYCRIIACFIYYAAWMWWIPNWLGYRIRPEVLDVSDNGANAHRLTKVPVAELEQWDAEHDEAGNLLRRRNVAVSQGSLKGEGSDGFGGEHSSAQKV